MPAAPADVASQDRVATGGEHGDWIRVRHADEGLREHARRPAVDDDEQGNAAALRVAGGIREESFNGETVRRLPLDHFGATERSLRQLLDCLDVAHLCGCERLKARDVGLRRFRPRMRERDDGRVAVERRPTADIEVRWTDQGRRSAVGGQR